MWKRKDGSWKAEPPRVYKTIGDLNADSGYSQYIVRSYRPIVRFPVEHLSPTRREMVAVLTEWRRRDIAVSI